MHSPVIRTIFLCLCLKGLAIAASGPDERVITDPRSIASVQNQAARPAPIDDLYYTRRASGPAWSPDGQEIVFSTNITGRMNLWKVRSSGGWPLQLAQSDDVQSAAVWSPDGKWLVYQQDHAGNELYDLYVIPSEGGEPANLTNTPDIREQDPHWSHNGKTIGLSYKPKTATSYDLALMDWATHQVHKLTNERETGFSWQLVAWSKDDKTIYANRTNPSSTDTNIYRIDVATGVLENLTPHQGTVNYYASSLSPDGTTLLLSSDVRGGYMNVALMDTGTKKLTWSTDTKWEALSGSFSPDGKTFTYVVNEDGLANAFLADTASQKAAKLELPQGLNSIAGNPTEFSPQGDRLIVSHEASNQPGDLWVYDLANHRPTQLTFSTIASLAAIPLAPSQIIHYKSFDGKIISALLWMPFNLQRDGSNPALVLPHGGPTGQTVDNWSPRVQTLVSRGYICIAPNPRGSTGYGLDFQKANFQDLGGGDLKDELAGVEFLKATGFVDPKKIGITGGSYGGFMTLMAIGKTPNVWAAAVELYGIIDWSSMLKNSDPSLNEYLKGLLGDPAKSQKIYTDASPITYIADETAPLLVLQGDNDPRVPKEEAVQVVDLLKKKDRLVEAHYYPNEGHGFAKRENQIDSLRRTVEWFDKYLKGVR